MHSLEGQLQDANAKRDMLNKELQTTPPLLTTEQLGGPGGSAALAAAEQKLAEMRLQYTDQSPDVIAQRRLVDALRAGKIPSGIPAPAAPRSTTTAAPASRSVPNPIFEQLKVSEVNTEAAVSSLTRQLAEAQADLARLEAMAHNAPGLENDYTQMNRDYDVLRKNYEELLGRRESMRIGKAADTDAEKIKTQIVDPPQAPRTPVAPKRVLLTLGVLAAAVAGDSVSRSCSSPSTSASTRWTTCGPWACRSSAASHSWPPPGRPPGASSPPRPSRPPPRCRRSSAWASSIACWSIRSRQRDRSPELPKAR